MIKVEGYPNLYRDEESGAIINYDTSSYNQYLSSLRKKEEERKEINQMKKDIDEIKMLLKEIINGSK